MTHCRNSYGHQLTKLMCIQTQKFETYQWFILSSTIALSLWGEGGGEPN